MNQTAHFQDEIQVRVELLDSSLEPFTRPEAEESRAFKADLWQHLGDLVMDLKIPSRVSLKVRFSEEREGLDRLVPYRVFVNGIKCRLQLPVRLPPERQARALAAFVAHSVYRNRELLLTPRLSEQILERWLAEAGAVRPPDLNAEAFHVFLCCLIRRGFAIDRGRAVASSGCKEQQDAVVCFEEAVSGLDTTRIGVLFKNEEARPQPGADGRSIEKAFDQTKDLLFYELGLYLPRMHLGYDERLEANAFRIQLNDLRLPPRSGLSPDAFFVDAPPESLSFLGGEVRPATHPADGSRGTAAEYSEEALEKCREKSFSTWGPADFVMLCLAAEIRKHAGNFLSAGTVQFSLSLLKERFPALVDAASRRFELKTLVPVLRELLDEAVSIRNLPHILEGLLAIRETAAADYSASIVLLPDTGHVCPVTEPRAPEDLAAVDYAAFIRIHLQRLIIYESTGGYNTLPFYATPPELEERLRSAEHPLTDRELNELRQAVFERLSYLQAQPPVLVTALDVRRKLRRLIQEELPWLTVLSRLEIPPHIRGQFLGQIP